MPKLNAYELAAAEAIRQSHACGGQIDGERVFCNDPRLPDDVRRPADDCFCIKDGTAAARAVCEVAAITTEPQD